MIKKDHIGWLQAARHCPSPNFNHRPHHCDISLLVIHNISLPAGEFGTGYIEQLFTNTLDCTQHKSFDDLEGLEVSAHCLIDRLGQVTQFVSFEHRAWHAGRSNYQGRENCNDYSIGIEMEGTDNVPYTPAQYDTLARVTTYLISHYPIDKNAIVGHCDIAPGRKTDPGSAFDWSGYFSMLAKK